jgi:hypothetical protein
LDYFSTDPEIRLLLVERLHRFAKDHVHAKTMIDRWLDTQTAAPKVSDLASLAAQVRTTSQGLPAGCDVCQGAPFVITGDGGKRCDCPRGQALRILDQRHAA